MSERTQLSGLPQRSGFRRLALTIALLGVLAGLILAWSYRDYLRPAPALYREAQEAAPQRAAVLYERLAEELPQIKEYTHLWMAQAAMPDLEALRTLKAVIDFRPHSPAAYQAHVTIARHYAGLDAPQAEESYRAALALHDPVALRLELARYLEEQGDNHSAYAEYHHILDYRQLPGKRADAFAGMRRTGPDPLTVAEDLISATYFTDALETLRNIDAPEALPWRGQVLAALGRYDEAETAYRDWLKETPDDTRAQLGLARVLERLDRTDEALDIYEKVDTPDSKMAQAALLAEADLDQALALYSDSPYPAAWWAATTLLESQGRLTETLPLYARVAKSDANLADDAAYRLYVLAQRLQDSQAQVEGEALLAELGLNWLALRAAQADLKLATASPLAPAGPEIIDKVKALESIGRADLAHLELVLTARFRRAPEIDLAMAEALAGRGYVVDSQQIAEDYINHHPQAPLAFWKLSYPRPYSVTVEAAATEFEVDPLLIWAVMREESRYDANALSIADAQGLMQVIPPTRAWIAGELGEEISPGDAYTPEASIRMGAWFLRFLIDHFEGDLELVIPAYNAGPANVESWQTDPRVSDRDDLLRWIGFGETRLYLERVVLSYQVYQKLYPQ